MKPSHIFPEVGRVEEVVIGIPRAEYERVSPRDDGGGGRSDAARIIHTVSPAAAASSATPLCSFSNEFDSCFAHVR